MRTIGPRVVYKAPAPENLRGKGWTVALTSDQLPFASNRNLNIGLKLSAAKRLERQFSSRP